MMIEKLKSKSVTFYFRLGIIMTVAGVLFSEGFYHFDEHFQILEFAGLKIGTTQAADLPWEFHEQMRPTLQPVLVIVIWKILDLVGLASPFLVATVTRLLTGVLVIWVAKKSVTYLRAMSKTENYIKVFLLCFFCTWFIGFSHYRFSSENWSGIFLILAFLEYQINKARLTWENWLYIGIWLGVSFLCRYQIAFAIAGFGIWLLIFEKVKIKWLSLMTATFGVLFFLGIAIDSWFYGEWTISTWNYFEQNILLDKVSGFGVEPWYYYFTSFIEKGMPPISLLILGGVGYYFWQQPKSGFTFMLLCFLLGHIAVGHKELRFLLPMTYLLPFVMVWFYYEMKQRFPSLQNKKLYTWSLSIVLIANFALLLFVSISKSEGAVSIYRKVYNISQEKPVVLYHDASNPYVRIIPVKYYQSNTTIVRQMDRLEDIPLSTSDTSVLFACKVKDGLEIPKSFQEIYSTYPHWMQSFNFNGWMDRTNFWKVYEVE